MCGNAAEEAFADQVSQYWVNFAATGNPNGPGLPHWSAANELPRGQVMRLDGDGSGVGAWLTPEQDALYTAQFNQRVATPLGIPAAGN